MDTPGVSEPTGPDPAELNDDVLSAVQVYQQAIRSGLPSELAEQMASNTYTMLASMRLSGSPVQ